MDFSKYEEKYTNMLKSDNLSEYERYVLRAALYAKMILWVDSGMVDKYPEFDKSTDEDFRNSAPVLVDLNNNISAIVRVDRVKLSDYNMTHALSTRLCGFKDTIIICKSCTRMPVKRKCWLTGVKIIQVE